MELRNKIPLRLPRLGTGKPLRFLGRRLIQVMAENAVSNFILGERSVPGQFLVLRLATDENERAAQEQEFNESRAAIEAEVAREAATRAFRLRSPLELELRVFTDADLETEAFHAVAAAQGASPPDLAVRLREER